MASTALTQARSENMSLAWYVWRTSGDARVRLSHRRMEGVLVAWNEPPNPEALIGVESPLGHYQAGTAPDCRCYPEPLLDLTQVRFPAKIYHAGQTQRMTRAAFAQLSGLETPSQRKRPAGERNALIPAQKNRSWAYEAGLRLGKLLKRRQGS